MKATAVIGANFGDEGKGLMTDYFSSSSNNTLVVRYNGGAQAGHCQSGDSLIFTQNGLKYIEDLVGEETNNKYSYDLININSEIESTSLLFRKNNSLYNLIQLSNGVEFKCTSEHKFYVWNSKINKLVWTKSKDLNKEFHQFIFPKQFEKYKGSEPKINNIVSETDFVHNKTKLDVSKFDFCHIAELMGLCNGDGNFTNKCIKLYLNIKELDVAEWYQKMLFQMGISCTIKYHYQSKKCIIVYLYSVEFIEILNKLGCYLNKLENKRTPLFVMNGTTDIISSYLRGLFDSDGTVTFHKHRGKNKYGRVRFSNCSRIMVQEMQQLLYLLGIHSCMSIHLPNKKRKNNKTQFLLEICGEKDLLIFKNKVGFRSNYKSEKLKELLEFKYIKNNNSLGFNVLVSDKKKIQKLCKKLGRNSSKIKSGFIINNAEFLHNSEFQDLVLMCKKYHVIDIDKILINHGKCDVFDLTMPKTHSYISNGTISHNTVVTPEGKRHVFSHFGSGSFTGAATFLSKEFIINPMLWKKELEILQKLGVNPTLFYSDFSRFTLPYDMLINQEAERSKGNARHGSCGLGINETVIRKNEGSNPYIPTLSFKEKNAREKAKSDLLLVRDLYCRDRIRKLDLKPDKKFFELFESDNLVENYLDVLFEFLSKNNVVMLEENILLENKIDNVVFEGAQGLLLDEDHEFFPHVTRSKTGLKNVLSLCEDMGISNLDVVYVTRAYMTRHGRGPFPTEDLNLSYKDTTNVPNEFQESLRFGCLDLDLLARTIDNDLQQTYGHSVTVSPQLAITHLDQVPSNVEFKHGNKIVKSSGYDDFIQTVAKECNMLRVFVSTGSSRNSVTPTLVTKERIHA